MEKYDYTKHARDMIVERVIKFEWIYEALDFPDGSEFIDNKELHFIK